MGATTVAPVGVQVAFSDEGRLRETDLSISFGEFCMHVGCRAFLKDQKLEDTTSAGLVLGFSETIHVVFKSLIFWFKR